MQKNKLGTRVQDNIPYRTFSPAWLFLFCVQACFKVFGRLFFNWGEEDVECASL